MPAVITDTMATDLSERISAAASDQGFDDPQDMIDMLAEHGLEIVDKNSTVSIGFRSRQRVENIRDHVADALALIDFELDGR